MKINSFIVGNLKSCLCLVKFRIALLVMLLSLGTIGCSSDSSAGEAIDPDVAAYLKDLVRIMENNSVYRNEIDWEVFEIQVLTDARGAESVDQLEGVLQSALERLGDNLGYVRKLDGTLITSSIGKCAPIAFNPVIVPDNIGYIQIPTLNGTNPNQGINYAQNIHQQIAAQDAVGLLGWVVDLRNNNGENILPMLAAIGPILGTGTSWFLIDPERNITTVGYDFGTVTINGFSSLALAESYELVNPNPKVAVLLNNSVSGAGEALAIAFVGRGNTQSFGAPTCGLVTVTTDYNLPDGAVLSLSTERLVDRQLKTYEGQVIPEVPAGDLDIEALAFGYITN